MAGHALSSNLTSFDTAACITTATLRKMFDEVRKIQQPHNAVQSMLACNRASDDWDGTFTVNYNLDNETGFDSDVDSSTYGNYKNHWYEPKILVPYS